MLFKILDYIATYSGLNKLLESLSSFYQKTDMFEDLQKTIAKIFSSEYWNIQLQIKTNKQNELLEYYGNLSFKEVKELQIFPVQTRFAEQSYRDDQQVYYQNKESLQKKINTMRNADNTDIQILADFDRTITPRDLKGNPQIPSLGIFRESDLISDEVRDKLYALFKYYYPKEKDITIPQNEKVQLIEEWYDKVGEVLASQKISIDLITKILESSNIGLRNKASEFLKICQNFNMNLTVVSGGASEVIATMIAQYINLQDYENLDIYANEMNISNGILQKIPSKINPVGKHMVITNEKINNRKNIILLGDILADVNMVQNVDYENMICVGFLNKAKNSEELPQYLEKYDIVITNDGSFDTVNEILSTIITN